RNDTARARAEPRRPVRGSRPGGGPGRNGSPGRSGGGVAPVTAVRKAAAFVSSVLTLVACGGGAGTQPSPTADRTACEVRLATPRGVAWDGARGAAGRARGFRPDRDVRGAVPRPGWGTARVAR